MVTVQSVREMLVEELEKVKNLNAEEYCADKVKAIYDEFETNKNSQIAKLENAIEAIDVAYTKLEEAEEQTDEEETSETEIVM